LVVDIAEALGEIKSPRASCLHFSRSTADPYQRRGKGGLKFHLDACVRACGRAKGCERPFGATAALLKKREVIPIGVLQRPVSAMPTETSPPPAEKAQSRAERKLSISQT